MSINCPLCQNAGGEMVWQNELARIVLADEPDYPGFCRVILQQHAAEMTDLPAEQRQALMDIVWAVETVVRNTLQPTKINVASLGNVVPHVHWHIIPRWQDDMHFPAPIWGTAAPNRSKHALTASQLSQLRQQLEQLTP